MSDSKTISFIFCETITITFQIIAVLFNGAIVLCTLRKKSLMKCPSTKFVFSLCISHLLISIFILVISIMQPIMDLSSTATSVRDTVSEQTLFSSSNDESLGSSIDSTISKTSQPINDESILLIQKSGITDDFSDDIPQIFNYMILYFTLTVSLGTSFTVAIISIERYITIARPMKYKSIITPARCTISIAFCWIFSLILVTSPIPYFGNRILIYHEAFAVPIGQLGHYYAFLFSCTTFGVLTIMIVCYGHIFKIAKEKCQKVQIGHFTSPVSSISSDWASSVYSSQGIEGLLQQSPSPASTTSLPHVIPSSSSSSVQKLPLPPSSSLLQYVLVANLGRRSQSPLRSPYTLTLVNDLLKSDSGSGKKSLKNYAKKSIQRYRIPKASFSKLRKWTTFLQQNYNSPRKTIYTIVILISSLVLTQLPLSIVLFHITSSSHTAARPRAQNTNDNNEFLPYPAVLHGNGNPILYYFCFRFLFSISSMSNPILYGFLNRNIRTHLWKFFKVQGNSLPLYQFTRPSFTKNFGRNNRKASSVSSENQNYLNRSTRDYDDDLTCCIGAINGKPVGTLLPDCDSQHSQSCSTLVLTMPIKSTLPSSAQSTTYCESNLNAQTNMTFEAEAKVIMKDDDDQGNGNQDEEDVDNADEFDDYDEIMDEELLSLSSFPRKPSQDSGTYMAFSDDDDFEEQEVDEDDEDNEDVEAGRRKIEVNNEL